ncbi:hypothetical protein SAMN04487969_102482 [Paenibacillus algorifonticola]|uniref:Uncharacterized protein n=1 Tax=Paenibacillus algorifonticola TaxID=684063 RepID=A0A1I2AJQ0_9BACL|nr:hypothetical protein [Paenibacillus algorifonticola]SFE43080.1 hypothetical protein SAMN04487969_102482 [Paenibacillus algorifonticola]
MSKTKYYGAHQVVTNPDGEIDLVYTSGRVETWYTQRGNRYYREEESTNVRSAANALRRISRAEFEEIHRLIVAVTGA